MTVAELLRSLHQQLGPQAIDILGGGANPQHETLAIGKITTDSREVRAADCFIAIKGARGDGHSFVAQVAEAQPAVIIVEAPVALPASFHGLLIKVSSTRQAWAALAAQWSGFPSRELIVFGVTGTNGKTSTTYIIEHLLQQRALPCGVIGTIDHHLAGHVWPTTNTTPGPSELQSRLAEMKDRGARAVAMEVSSHALEQRRVDRVDFDAVIFTNLTRDHLDYHKTMEAYFSAKQLLFTERLWEGSKAQPLAVVNVRDEAGRKLRVSQKAELVTFGSYQEKADSQPDISYRIDSADFFGIEFTLFRGREPIAVKIPLVGNHQVENAIGAFLAVSGALEVRTGRGLELSAFTDLMCDFRGVPGRLEKVPAPNGVHVFVDYAHSPDALENVLSSLRGIRARTGQQNRIISVFGCGGDRDTGKRPMMAAVAERLSDEVMITSDNPRTEDPNKILDEVEAGFSADFRKVVRREVDRQKAIEEVIRGARSGDVVVIAGKGHEDYQEIHGQKHPFQDQQVVRQLEAR